MADGQEAFHDLIVEIWEQDVIKTINDVLDGDHYFGFKHFELYADPSVEDITRSITFIEAALTVFLDHPLIKPETESVLLNCQQCVHLMRRVFSALKRKDNDEYHDAVRKLKVHANRQ